MHVGIQDIVKYMVQKTKTPVRGIVYRGQGR